MLTFGIPKYVTPCAGVWIEIKNFGTYLAPTYVTPCAGVWIEMMSRVATIMVAAVSLPVRECGLKLLQGGTYTKNPGHSLRGSVD